MVINKCLKATYLLKTYKDHNGKIQNLDFIFNLSFPDSKELTNVPWDDNALDSASYGFEMNLFLDKKRYKGKLKLTVCQISDGNFKRVLYA
jgi:hypothetical protein